VVEKSCNQPPQVNKPILTIVSAKKELKKTIATSKHPFMVLKWHLIGKKI